MKELCRGYIGVMSGLYRALNRGYRGIRRDISGFVRIL